MIAWLAFAFAAPPPSETPARVVSWRDRVDWKLAGDEAVRTLSAYLQVDTSNPPGNEDRGVAFLGALLDTEGIPYRTVELSPGRSSLIARVAGTGAKPPLCLMHHIDVASFETEHWPAATGPLSGAISEEAVWGRGALDMKGMGVLQFLSVAWIRRLGLPLERDVILLAVADEEVDNGGAYQLATPEIWKDIGCSHLINEGGLGVTDALFEGQAVHAISVAEKGVLWVRMTASGRAGHGSVPMPSEEAPERLRLAMNAIAMYRPVYVIDDAIAELLSNAGAHHGGLAGAILQSRGLTRTVAWGQLKANPTLNAAMQDTVHLTGLSGAQQPNVVPSQVSALYDCRLLNGTTPEVHLARLVELTKKIEGIEFEVLHGARSNRSPTDDPLFERLSHYAVEDRPYAVAGPLLSVGFTDSLIFRPLDVVAYGYVPFEVSQEVAGTMHGHGEHVPVAQVHEGLRRMFSVVVDFAGAP